MSEQQNSLTFKRVTRVSQEIQDVQVSHKESRLCGAQRESAVKDTSRHLRQISGQCFRYIISPEENLDQFKQEWIPWSSQVCHLAQ
jgi:hypothetical protein